MMEKALVSKIVKCSIQYDDHIPEVSLSQYLLHEMSKWKSSVAIVSVSTKEEFTYGDLIHDINCLAAGLQASGLVKCGQCVAMALPNSIEFVVTLLAVSQVGAFISLINPVYTPRELKHVSSINNAGLWICTPEFVPLLSQLDKTGYKTLLVDSSNHDI